MNHYKSELPLLARGWEPEYTPSGDEHSQRYMKAIKVKQAEWTSDIFETMTQEIAELSHRYLVQLDALRQQIPGSDSYVDHWAEIAVDLEWLQMKIKDVLKEMEQLEETWPD